MPPRLEPLLGAGHPLVEEVYTSMRVRGASLVQEPLEQRTRTKDMLRSFWVTQHRKCKGDSVQLKKSFPDLPASDKVKNVEHFLMTDATDEMQRLDATRELTRLWYQMFSVEVPRRGLPSKRRLKAPPKAKRPYFLNCIGRVLLTWIGMWGRVSPTLDPQFDARTADPECVCALLREMPQVQDMWNKVQAALVTIAAQLPVFRYTGSMELCTDTLRREGRVQLYVHLFIQSGYNATHPPFRVEHAHCLALFGVAPHASGGHAAGKAGSSVNARGRNSNEASAAAGHYYLAMPRVGKMFTHCGNVEPWDGYAVRDVWISQFWQQNKLTSAAARGEYVKCKKLVRLHTENVDLFDRFSREQVAESRRAASAAALLRMTLPNVVIPEVAAWVESRQILQHRYKFLALEGASQVGKTSFARGLLGREACLVMDCSGDNTPCLRQYDSARHHVLVFDEGKASMVLCHKKLFQASIDEVTCGSSPTNQHAYVVCVHAACIIVTSNTWSEDVAGASVADRGWLVCNSLHLRIGGALWQEPGGNGCPPPYEVVGCQAGASALQSGLEPF